MTPPDDELSRTIERWCRALVARDRDAAAELRDPRYTFVLANGESLTRERELAMLASSEFRVTGTWVDGIRREGFGGRATANVRYALLREGAGPDEAQEIAVIVELVKRGGRWRAIRSRIPAVETDDPRPAVWRRVLSRMRRRPQGSSFQESAYLPYLPGEDFALPRSEARAADALPIPPRHLWLSYNYPATGKVHVDTMLGITGASGLTLGEGDRILDLGCGAGRMIRHLQPLAATCEIWGTDISAEHIFWCKRNLSPPFHFATTTKVPHLPFEDRSFRLVYCGSVFTHIDDLADAWLLELRRILAPDGRLYVTIHDEHTVQLVGDESRSAAWLGWVGKAEAFRGAKGSFDMISIGRDHESQVFYRREYFEGMARSAGFEVVSATPEAYFYQTAVLLRRL